MGSLADTQRNEDASNAKKFKYEITLLREKYKGLSINDLEERAKLLREIVKKDFSLSTCLYDNEEIEEVGRQMDKDKEQLNEIAKMLKDEIDQLVETFKGLSNNDLEGKAQMLQEISKKYNAFSACLFDENEVEEAERQRDLAEVELIKTNEIIENTRSAKVNKDSFVDGDTPNPIYDVDGNVKGFKREDDDR